MSGATLGAFLECHVRDGDGTHSPWVSRWLKARAHRVFVANVRKLRAISQSHTKNDVEDAWLLLMLSAAVASVPESIGAALLGSGIYRKSKALKISSGCYWGWAD